MDEQWCSNNEDYSETPATKLLEHLSCLKYELLERTYPSARIPLPPETQDLFDEVANTLKLPEEWDLNPIPRINLDDRNLMDRVRFNGKGVEIELGPVGAVAAVLGMLLAGAAGGGDSERIHEAEREAEEARRAQEQQRLACEEAKREAEEARRAQEQQRLAREEAEREAEEARRVQEQERLAQEEAERKEKLERSLREL
jgi:hypothetical protein